MTDLTVYRTRAPEILALWEENTQAHAEWAERVKTTLAELGMADRALYYNQQLGNVAGLGHDDGGDIPLGWRVERRTSLLVPRLTTKQGKTADAALGRLRQPDVRVHLPGMPRNCLVEGGYLLTCGARLMQDAVYIEWGQPIPESQVDLKIWERVRLSEFYAVLEMDQDAESASETATAGEPS